MATSLWGLDRVGARMIDTDIEIATLAARIAAAESALAKVTAERNEAVRGNHALTDLQAADWERAERAEKERDNAIGDLATMSFAHTMESERADDAMAAKESAESALAACEQRLAEADAVIFCCSDLFVRNTIRLKHHAESIARHKLRSRGGRDAG